MHSLYILPFLISFAASVAICSLIMWLSGKIKEKRRKENRHIHSNGISRIGGLAIILSFLAAIFLDKNLIITQSLWGVILGAAVLLFSGLIDDFWELDWRNQLFFQISAIVLIFITGTRIEYITSPFGGFIFLNMGKYLLPSLFFVILWMLLVMNSMNWIDGIDGLSGGISIIGVFTIFLLSLRPDVNQPPVGIISMALAGSILGFLIFNFHPARVLAGTSGAIFMGFMLSVMAIYAGTKIATTLLIMSVPVIDTLWVIGERISAKKSIYNPDKRHLHYKLMEMGWSQKKISLFFCAVTILIAFVALNTRAIGKIITIFLILLIMGITFIWLRKKTKQTR